MQSKAIGSALKNLLQICSRNHILNVERVNTLPSLHYGPLGSLLKKNIFNEWLLSLLKNKDVHIFPVEITHPRTESFLLQKPLDLSKDCLLSAVIDNYADTIKYFGQRSPLGFAVYGPCVNQQTSPHDIIYDMDLNFLRSLKAWNRISVIFFCPSTKPMHWFQYWSKQRCLWWRKFSSIPSKFSLSEVTRTTSGSHQLSLIHESPWGKDRLETVTLHDNHYVKDLFEKYHSEKPDMCLPNVTPPAVITCEAELDFAVFSYLSNSYVELWREGDRKEILHLHDKLAPYKVCVLLDQNAAPEHMKKLENVASHLTEEFKEVDISVLPTSFVNFNKISHFERLDEMGVPYSVILNEDSLFTGFAKFRSRDTTIENHIHLAELTSTLLNYLKMEKVKSSTSLGTTPMEEAVQNMQIQNL